MKSTLHLIGLKILFAALFLISQNPSQARILYVNNTATGSVDGSSWTNAFFDIQSAIDAAATGDTIWIASGTYLPTHKQSGTSDRNKTFYINKPILLFGGFSGAAGSEGDFSQRNMQSFETILSGNLGLPGDEADNAFHVVYLDHVTDATRLDGFTIAQGNNSDNSFGAGIFNDAEAGISFPIIANCIIRDNTSTETGGGMGNLASEGGIANPTLLNCKFINNVASSGGGMGNYTDDNGFASPTLINCQFLGNTAPTGQGGAISMIAHSSTSSPMLINCILSGNHSPTSSAINAFGTGTTLMTLEIYNSTLVANSGGSIRVVDLGEQASSVILRNSILWNNAGNHGLTTSGASTDVNFSIMQFGFDGEGNFSDNPLFVSEPPLQQIAHTLGDLHLVQGSPAIDAGSNAEVPQGITTDLDNLPRFVNPINGLAGIVDVGPYEFQGNTTAISDLLSDADWNLFPNPVKDHVVITTSQSEPRGELLILDTRGQFISMHPISEGQHDLFDISRLLPGTYFVHVTLNGLQGVRQIVVQ